eukprot:4380546-Pyramimonas_sp.AAC.1
MRALTPPQRPGPPHRANTEPWLHPRPVAHRHPVNLGQADIASTNTPKGEQIPQLDRQLQRLVFADLEVPKGLPSAKRDVIRLSKPSVAVATITRKCQPLILSWHTEELHGLSAAVVGDIQQAAALGQNRAPSRRASFSSPAP